jgi:hypothetical protein
MRKLLLVVVGLAVFGMLATQANALTLPKNLYRASLNDQSSIFNKVTGLPEVLNEALDPGDEQRNLFLVDAINLGKPGGTPANVLINPTGTGYTPYTSNLLSGLLYDAVFTGHSTGGVGSSLSVASTLPTDLYFAPGPRYSDAVAATGTDGLWTDMVVSPTSGAATTALGYGGLVVIYADPAINSSYAGDGVAPIGPADWVEANYTVPAGQFVTDAAITTGYVDAFPTFTEPGLEPWLIMTLAPLPAVFGAPAGTVIMEDNYKVVGGAISATGLAFGNIIGGTAATNMQWMLDYFGPGLDVRFNFSVTGSTTQLTQDGWQLSSADPVQFGILPEPGVMSLLGLGIVSLLGIRKIRKQK